MMRATLSRESLRPLLETRHDLCLSLFLSTDRTGMERSQDQLHMRHLLHEAEHQMRSDQAHGFSIQVEPLLEPLWTLLDDKTFWQHANDGLAIFSSPKLFRALRLPVHFQEQVVLGDHFYLKPLLPLLTYDGHFYVLALSQNAVRLLACTPEHVRKLKLPEQMPTSLADFLRGEERANDLQSHSSASFGTTGKGGRHPAIFHGQGAGIDEAKHDLLRYFQHIDRGLHDVLRDETMPLVLASVGYLLPIYQQANSYPHLLEQEVVGNPDKLTDETLHEKAWPLVEPGVLQAQQEAAAQYQNLACTEHTSSNSSEIVPAAFYGRVASLFVASDQAQWGTFDPISGAFQIHEQAQPGDEDLLDLAATQTLLHGGAVYAVEQAEMPDVAPLAAVFRYPSL